MEKILLYFSLKYNGDFDMIYHALKTKEPMDYEYFELLKKGINCRYTTIISDDYPEQLKNIYKPPFVLFYYGNLDLIKQSTIAMVGMRKSSEYGKLMALDISKYLVSQNKVVVSGMAQGIDTYSHLGAIQAGGNTIAVLGSGIDYCYPKSNLQLYERIKNNHLLISEYPNVTTPKKENFPMRNRIVVGLSKSLVIVESNIKSGSMISASLALEQGKEIYCVPGRWNDPKGCNYLISQGANIIFDFKDIE